MSLQLGCTKYCCFLCEWDRRAKNALPEERLPSEEISEGRREEWSTPSTGRMAHKPATVHMHEIRSDEILRKSHGLDRKAFKYLAEKFRRLSVAKIKEVFFWVLRSASNSETIYSTTYFRVTTKMLGTHFVWCQLTSSGMSGQKISRNWLRTCCHCITNMGAICPYR
jgi:hypothetical protein